MMRIVSHEHRFVYFPVTKVACSSIKSALTKPILGEYLKAPHSVLKTRRDSDSQRFSNYFKFAFVRNPWSRAVSCFSEKIRPVESKYRPLNNKWFQDGIAKGLLKFGVFKANMSFEEFVDAICGIPDREAETHFVSQYKFLTGKNGNLVVDFIGKFERLHTDFERVCKAIGLEPLKLPKINASRHDNYLKFYNKETIRKIAKRYKKDIDLFGYKFRDEK